MNEQAIKNRQEVEQIKVRFYSGEIDFDQAKELLQPIIERMYQQQLAIGKKYGKKPRKCTNVT